MWFHGMTFMNNVYENDKRREEKNMERKSNADEEN